MNRSELLRIVLQAVEDESDCSMTPPPASLLAKIDGNNPKHIHTLVIATIRATKRGIADRIKLRVSEVQP